MPHCPICSKSVEIIYKNHPSYIKNKFYDILFCNYCNTSFADAIICNRNIYNEIYEKSDGLDGYERYNQYAKSIISKKKPLNYLAAQEDVYFFVAHSLKRFAKKKVKILEIGCGLGYLTYALNKEGFSATGIDVSHSAIKMAIEKFGAYFYAADAISYAQITNLKYDVIIATEVIEHIPDIKSFLIQLKNLLNPEGIILLTTPNKSAFDSSALWVTDAPPLHLWWLSEESLVQLTKSVGMHLELFNIANYNRGSHYYWKNTESLDHPVFIPRFEEDGAIGHKKKKRLIKQLQLKLSYQGIKVIKSFLLSLGLKTTIQRLAHMKMKLQNVHRSIKPYTLYAQISLIDE
ncbi:MAG TPA: class I SAM-dependent methyltransferase [Bacteroidales bacterium]|nr:class I SAM-dependent methyltransferase [Bacteroidales bacterium]